MSPACVSATPATTRIKSGVTVIVCDEPAVAGVQVLGGAPGTRETDLLEPHNSVEAVNAIVLSGGSAFGLDAASGVQAALREMGIGFEVGGHRVPIVPTAIVFDLRNGGDKDWGRYPPYRELGYEAVRTAARRFQPRHHRRRHRRADVRAEGRPRLGIDRPAERRHRRRAGDRQCDRLGHGRPFRAFLGGALGGRRRVRRARLPLAFPRGCADGPPEIPRQAPSGREHHHRRDRHRRGNEQGRRQAAGDLGP